MGLGFNIKTAREHLGWTLDQLSAACGVKTSTLGMLEQRDSKTNRDATDIASALGVPIRTLLKGTDAEVLNAIEQSKNRGQHQYFSEDMRESTQYAANARSEPYLWPFKNVSTAQWQALDAAAKALVESMAMELVSRTEQRDKSEAPSAAKPARANSRQLSLPYALFLVSVSTPHPTPPRGKLAVVDQ